MTSLIQILLGALAGATIFIGLPLARWRAPSERTSGLLSLASAGLLLFLVIEVGYHAMEAVRGHGTNELPLATFGAILLMFVGFTLGLVGLTWLEQRHPHAHAENVNAVHVATGMAAGIGLHSFAEGLTIGQSFASGQAPLGTLLLIGAALHNTLEGFGIAATLTGRHLTGKRLLGLGLLAGAPTALGVLLGGVWVNPLVELLCLSVSTGSLVYVIRELLRLRFQTLSDVAAMTALAVGLFLGFGTELVVAGAHSPAPLHAYEKNDQSPSIPDVSPRLSMTTLDGEPVTLLPFRGKVTLLDIWATWCPPCVKALPRLQVLHDRYAAKGFTVVGVSLDADGANTVRPFLAQRNLTYPMLLDTGGPDSARQALKIETLPTQVLVDSSGNVIRRWTGAANDDEIEAAIINALRKTK